MASEFEQAIRSSEDTLTNTPSQGQAILAGITGTGTLQVARGQQGEAMEVIGTWRLADDSDNASTERLDRAYETGESVWYEGRLDDPARPEKKHVKSEVKITSARNYEFNQHKYEGENATRKTLYGFTTVADLP